MGRSRTQQVSGEHWARGDYKDWFDVIYSEAGGDPNQVPWADLAPNPYLVRWLDEHTAAPGQTALVVGCGLGDDAEATAAAGYTTTAFDIAPNAIAWAQQRWPDTRVTYVTADLFALPASFHGAYDLIVEHHTLQALPLTVRAAAIDAISACLKPDGRVYAFGRYRDESDPIPPVPPIALTAAELAHFDAAGLRRVAFRDFLDQEQPPIRRFEVVYQR